MNATRDHKVKIANGDSQPVAGPFDFIRLKTTTGPLIIDINGLQTELVAGQAIRFRGEPVTDFVITNNSGAEVTATFKLGYRADIEDTTLSGTVDTTKATTYKQYDRAISIPVAPAAPLLLLPANAARREAIIRNIPASAGDLYIGNADVAVLKSHAFSPGERVILTHTDDIYVRGSAANVHLDFSEILD